jgi:hypothetical protein
MRLSRRREARRSATERDQASLVFFRSGTEDCRLLSWPSRPITDTLSLRAAMCFDIHSLPPY